jgi:hypothetical protein
MPCVCCSIHIPVDSLANAHMHKHAHKHKHKSSHLQKAGSRLPTTAALLRRPAALPGWLMSMPNTWMGGTYDRQQGTHMHFGVSK